MFCNNCGKQIAENLRFCTFCGSAVAEVAKEAAPAPVGASYVPPQQGSGAQQFVPQQAAPAYQQQYVGYAASATVEPKRKNITQALSALFAVLTIIALLVSGLTVTYKMSRLADSLPFGMNIRIRDLKLTMPLFAIAGTVGQANGMFSDIKREMEKEIRQSGYSYLEDSLNEMEDVTKGFRTAAVALGIMRIISIITVLALVLSIFLMLIGNKNGALLGQIGGSLAVIAAIGIIIAGAVTASNISDLLRQAGGSIGDMITVGASFWTYISILFGALTVLFITVRKSIIRGY